MNKLQINKINNFYQVESPYGRISIFITSENKIDKKSLIPFVNIDHDIDYNEVNKILIEYGHQNKCRYYNYLILEFLSNL